MVTRRRIVGGALAFATAACGWIAGIDNQRFTVVDNPDKCEHLDPPPPPTGVDQPNDIAPIVFVLSKFSAPAATEGFDLDHVCTCDQRDIRGPDGGAPTCTSSKTSCDADGGVDNGGAALSNALEPYLAAAGLGGFKGLIDMETQQAVCGQASIVFLLDHYTGEADDPVVLLAPTTTGGIVERPDAGEVGDASGCVLADDAAALEPTGTHRFPARLDGTDRWSVPPDFITAGMEDEPHIESGGLSGYVSNFHLVIDLRDAPTLVPILLGGVYLNMTGVIVTADIVATDKNGKKLDPVDGHLPPNAARYELRHGLVAGRASANTLLSTAGSIRILVNEDGTNLYACDQPFVIDTLQKALCETKDIASSPKDLDAPCDALSLSVGFEAISGRIASARIPRGDAHKCPPRTCP